MHATSGDPISTPFHKSDYFKGVALVFAATLFWSLSGIFVRSLSTSDGMEIAIYRAFFAAVTLFIALAVRYRAGVFQRFRVMAGLGTLLCGGFFASASTLYILSLANAPVANVSCVAATSPLFAAVLARLLLGERTTILVWLAALIALAGVFITMQGDLGGGNFLGTLMALGVAFCFAGQSVSLRWFRNVDMVPAICLGAFGMAAVLALVHGLPPISLHDLGLIGAMAVVQLALPLYLFVVGARYIPAVQATLINLLDVLFNPFWAWLGVGERPTVDAAIGGSLIVGAVFLAIVYGARASARAASEPAAGAG
jgi:drug/metabolite transporter (DMT)-like permease